MRKFAGQVFPMIVAGGIVGGCGEEVDEVGEGWNWFCDGGWM